MLSVDMSALRPRRVYPDRHAPVAADFPLELCAAPIVEAESVEEDVELERPQAPLDKSSSMWVSNGAPMRQVLQVLPQDEGQLEVLAIRLVVPTLVIKEHAHLGAGRPVRMHGEFARAAAGGELIHESVASSGRSLTLMP